MHLTNSPLTANSLGYCKFTYPERNPTNIIGAAALEFLHEDSKIHALRHVTLPVKCKNYRHAFLVYYKSPKGWEAIPTPFTELHLAIPYLQSGNRVLIEYFNPEV